MSDEIDPPDEMIDLDSLVAKPGHAPHAWQSKAPAHTYSGHKPPITYTEDLGRILALPRRPQLDLESDRAMRMVDLITTRYARARTTPCRCRALAPKRFLDGANGCITRLNAVQAWALYEIGIVQGLEGAVGVGHGKTLCDILAPLALADAWQDANRRRGVAVDRAMFKALLLVPPGLIDQLASEYTLVAEHFRVPSIVFHSRPIRMECDGEPWLHVYPYSQLSRPGATTFFGTLKPHAVICDEAHMISDPGSVRGGRVADYMEIKAPETRFCNWTGSLTDSSITEYAHLIKWALKERSPLPLDPIVVREWAAALDPGNDPDDENQGWVADPGALLEGLIATGCCKSGDHVYKGFHTRLTETLGFVATRSPAVTCGLEIHARLPHVDDPDDSDDGDHVPNVPREDESAPDGAWPGIADALAMVRNGVRPDGEELIEALPKARCARELASGFFYRWTFPRGEPDELVTEWKKKRGEYRREVRDLLKDREEHLDSPYLCEVAAMRYHGDIPRGGVVEILDEDDEGKPIVRRVDTSHLPVWPSKAWPAWRDIRSKVQPVTKPVWIDEYLAHDAVEWAREHRGIVWYDHAAFGLKVAKLGGFAMHSGGPGASERLLGKDGVGGEDGTRSIVVSIKSHGTGRDGLQLLFDEQLVANPLASSDGWEQLLGRLHRIRQRSPVVRTWFYRHTAELKKHVDQALCRALYVQSTIGASQKLRMGFSVRE